MRQQLGGSEIILRFLHLLRLVVVLTEIIAQIHGLEIQIVLLRPKQLSIDLARCPCATSILFKPINGAL